jgi:hypothetical protein
MRLHRFRFSGKIAIVICTNFPGFAGHRPAFHGGFCVSRWAVLHGQRVPANLPVGRDLTIRRKIENGRYYCAFWLFETNQGTRSRSTRAVLKPPPRRRCTKPFMGIPIGRRSVSMSVRGSMPDTDRGKDRRLPAAAGK